MKRIFSILLLFGLMLCLAVPTFADTYSNTYNVTFKKQIDISSLIKSEMTSVLWEAIRISDGSIVTGDKIVLSKSTDGSATITFYKPGYSSGTFGIDYDKNGFLIAEDLSFNNTWSLTVHSNYQLSQLEKCIILMCDGSSCPATDVNEDNICDDCGKALSYSLRNDTYSFNGYSFPRTMELEDGSTVDIFDYWEQLGGLYNFVILSRTGNFDSALFYLFAPNVEFINGNAVTAVEDTNIILFKPSFTEDGTPYWKYEATDIRGTKGAVLASKEQVLWSAKTIISGDSNPDIIEGDPNFMPPLWEMVEKVTQGEMPKMTESLVGSVTLLTACGIGLLALLVVLVLLRRKSVLFFR